MCSARDGPERGEIGVPQIRDCEAAMTAFYSRTGDVFTTVFDAHDLCKRSLGARMAFGYQMLTWSSGWGAGGRYV